MQRPKYAIHLKDCCCPVNLFLWILSFTEITQDKVCFKICGLKPFIINQYILGLMWPNLTCLSLARFIVCRTNQKNTCNYNTMSEFYNEVIAQPINVNPCYHKDRCGSGRVGCSGWSHEILHVACCPVFLRKGWNRHGLIGLIALENTIITRTQERPNELHSGKLFSC